MAKKKATKKKATKKKVAKKKPTKKKVAKKKATKKKAAKKKATKKKVAKKKATKKKVAKKKATTKKKVVKTSAAKQKAAKTTAKSSSSKAKSKDQSGKKTAAKTATAQSEKAEPAAAETKAPPREKTHPGVSDFIGALAGEQAKVSTALRELIRQTIPAAEESIRWGHPCWSAKGDLCYLMISGAHVILGFFKGAKLGDTKGLLQGSGRHHRHIKVRTRDDIPAPQVKAWLREAARIERAA